MGTWGCDSLVIAVADVAAVCCCCKSWERRDDEKRTKNSAGRRRGAFHPFNFFSSLSSLGMTVVVVWRIRDPLDNIIRCISACLSALRAEARARDIGQQSANKLLRHSAQCTAVPIRGRCSPQTGLERECLDSAASCCRRRLAKIPLCQQGLAGESGQRTLEGDQSGDSRGETQHGWSPWYFPSISTSATADLQQWLFWPRFPIVRDHDPYARPEFCRTILAPTPTTLRFSGTSSSPTLFRSPFAHASCLLVIPLTTPARAASVHCCIRAPPPPSPSPSPPPLPPPPSPPLPPPSSILRSKPHYTRAFANRHLRRDPRCTTSLIAVCAGAV